MIDLSRDRNYYIACGYTDLRLGIDGLAAVVTQQFGGQLTEESIFLFAADGQTASKLCTGAVTVIFCYTSGYPTGDSSGPVRKQSFVFWIPRTSGGS